VFVVPCTNIKVTISVNINKLHINYFLYATLHYYDVKNIFILVHLNTVFTTSLFFCVTVENDHSELTYNE